MECIGFLGDGWGAVAAVKSLASSFSIEYLGSDPDVIEHLPSKHKLIKSIEEFSSHTLICSGYKPVIRKTTLEHHQVINIHYSLLPKYRGLHSTAWAIMNGEKELGLSIHLMNEFIDDGPIIHQERFINDNESSATHYMELFNRFIEQNLGDILTSFLNGAIQPKKQDKKQASWVGKRSAKHNFIDFTQSNEMIKRLFRVLKSPYPSPKFTYKGSVYSANNVGFHETDVVTDTSRILNIDGDGIWIKTQDGYAILSDIVNEDNKPVSLEHFKLGHYVND